MAETWTCPNCRTEADDATMFCFACDRPRYASWAIQVAEHVLEHIEDGLTEPLAVLKAMQERVCYAKGGLTLAFVAQQMRLLTKDTTTIARALLKARAANMALRASHDGASEATLLGLLKGIQVLGDVVEHKGDFVTRHVVELHDGPPPKREE